MIRFNKKQDIDHTLGDAIKNLKSGADRLKYFISNYKNSSFHTLKQVHLYSCQVIQKKIALIQYSIMNGSTWRAIECRTADLPVVIKVISSYYLHFLSIKLHCSKTINTNN